MGLHGPNSRNPVKDSDKVLKSFKDDGDEYNWKMSDEGTVTEYLGINIKKLEDGGYRLTQPGLAQKVLEATGMTKCSPAITPNSSDKPLGSDKNGPDCKLQDKWQYASVVGMLMYLVNSRPEIAFAVHQCARFTHGTKHSHEKAVLRICQYLKGTMNE